MLLSPKFILPITLILLSLTIGCDQKTVVESLIGSGEDNIEILIIGPYKTKCVGAFEQECYLEFNEETQKWEFFYEWIKGFDYKPGFIYTLLVSLHKRDERIADVGPYEYRLVEILDKEAASVDERPPRKP